MSHEMEKFLFNNHYPTSVFHRSLKLNTSKEIYIKNDLYKYIKGVM